MKEKKLRMILGLFMFQAFLSVAFLFGFIFNLPFGNVLLNLAAVGIFWYMWIPAILLIIQNYYLLTRVFKYVKSD